MELATYIHDPTTEGSKQCSPTFGAKKKMLVESIVLLIRVQVLV